MDIFKFISDYVASFITITIKSMNSEDINPNVFVSKCVYFFKAFTNSAILIYKGIESNYFTFKQIIHFCNYYFSDDERIFDLFGNKLPFFKDIDFDLDPLEHTNHLAQKVVDTSLVDEKQIEQYINSKSSEEYLIQKIKEDDIFQKKKKKVKNEVKCVDVNIPIISEPIILDPIPIVYQDISFVPNNDREYIQPFFEYVNIDQDFKIIDEIIDETVHEIIEEIVDEYIDEDGYIINHDNLREIEDFIDPTKHPDFKSLTKTSTKSKSKKGRKSGSKDSNPRKRRSFYEIKLCKKCIHRNFEIFEQVNDELNLLKDIFNKYHHLLPHRDPLINKYLSHFL